MPFQMSKCPLHIIIFKSELSCGSPRQTEMKRQLHQGDTSVLNIYTVDINLIRRLQGYATFPICYAGNPSDDGIVIYYETLPGGKARNNEGHIATHQVGHWVLSQFLLHLCAIQTDLMCRLDSIIPSRMDAQRQMMRLMIHLPSFSPVCCSCCCSTLTY